MKLAHTALIAGLGLGACTKLEPRTEVVVTISAEPGVRADAVKLQVVVRGGPAGALQRRASQTIGSVAAPVQFPVRIAVVPLNGDASRVFAVEATALSATDTSVGLVRATSTFLRHRTLALPLLIEDCCRPVFPTCTAGQTCRGCACATARVEPGDLDDYGADAGVAGMDGAVDPRCREDGGADHLCPDPLMFFTGTVCIDRQPALTASGEQGSALTWDDANTLCASRGARLCTEVERESLCDGTGDAYSPANRDFCIGAVYGTEARPIAETWEWSAEGCPTGTYRRSPCCNVIGGYGECSTMPSEMASYHCCGTPVDVDAGPPPACGAPTDGGLPAVCGDGIIDGDEECDSPNRAVCDALCRVVCPPTRDLMGRDLTIEDPVTHNCFWVVDGSGGPTGPSGFARFSTEDERQRTYVALADVVIPADNRLAWVDPLPEHSPGCTAMLFCGGGMCPPGGPGPGALYSPATCTASAPSIMMRAPEGTRR